MSDTHLHAAEAAAVATCRMVLKRLSLVLEEECLALGMRDLGSHGAFTERKNQLLRELINAQHNLESPGAAMPLQSEIAALREAIIRNQQALKIHIDAVREVSAIIVDSIRQAESDGTYSRHA